MIITNGILKVHQKSHIMMLDDGALEALDRKLSPLHASLQKKFGRREPRFPHEGNGIYTVIYCNQRTDLETLRKVVEGSGFQIRPEAPRTSEPIFSRQALSA